MGELIVKSESGTTHYDYPEIGMTINVVIHSKMNSGKADELFARVASSIKDSFIDADITTDWGHEAKIKILIGDEDDMECGMKRQWDSPQDKVAFQVREKERLIRKAERALSYMKREFQKLKSSTKGLPRALPRS